MIWLLCTLLVAAEPPTALEAGQPAPFAGVLLAEDELAALLAAELERTETRIQMRILQTEADVLEELYREKARQRTPKWYDQAQARFLAGFVAGAVITVAVAYSVARVLAHE